VAKQIDNLKSGSDQWKTILAVVVVIATLALYYVNPLNFNSLTKVLVTLALFIAAGGIFIKSSQGDTFVHFLKETRIELRKVVWPSREETLKTTGIIMIAVSWWQFSFGLWMHSLHGVFSQFLQLTYFK